MAVTLTIDTLAAKNILLESGFEDQKAEGIVRVLTDASENGVSEKYLERRLREFEGRLTDRLTTRIYGAQIATVLALITVLSFFGKIG